MLYVLCILVGRVTLSVDYGVDGPESNPGGDEIIRPVQTCPPVKWVPGGKVRPWRAADHSPSSSAAVMEE